MGNMPPEMRVEGYPKAVERKAVERAVQTEDRRWEGKVDGRIGGKETTHSTILTKSSTPKPSSHPSKSASHNSSCPKVPPRPLHKHTSPEPGLHSLQLDYGNGLVRTYTESWAGRVESPDGTSRTERGVFGGKAAVRVSLTTQGVRRKEERKAVRSQDVGAEVKRVTVSLTEPAVSRRQIGHKAQGSKPRPGLRAVAASLADLALVEKETVRQMFKTSKKGKEVVSLRNLSPSPLHSTLRLKPSTRS